MTSYSINLSDSFSDPLLAPPSSPAALPKENLYHLWNMVCDITKHRYQTLAQTFSQCALQFMEQKQICHPPYSATLASLPCSDLLAHMNTKYYDALYIPLCADIQTIYTQCLAYIFTDTKLTESHHVYPLSPELVAQINSLSIKRFFCTEEQNVLSEKVFSLISNVRTLYFEKIQGLIPWASTKIEAEYRKNTSTTLLVDLSPYNSEPTTFIIDYPPFTSATRKEAASDAARTWVTNVGIYNSSKIVAEFLEPHLTEGTMPCSIPSALELISAYTHSG